MQDKNSMHFLLKVSQTIRENHAIIMQQVLSKKMFRGGHAHVGNVNFELPQHEHDFERAVERDVSTRLFQHHIPTHHPLYHLISPWAHFPLLSQKGKMSSGMRQPLKAYKVQQQCGRRCLCLCVCVEKATTWLSCQCLKCKRGLERGWRCGEKGWRAHGGAQKHR